MKKHFSIPAVLVSSVLMIAASTIQADAAPLATIIANPARPATISVTPSGTLGAGDIVSIAVDFPTSGTGYSNYPLLTLQTDGGIGAWAPAAGMVDIKSTSAGTYTFKHPAAITEKVRVVAKETATYAAVTSPDR